MKISDEKYIALFSKYYPDDVHILGCLEHDSFQFDGYLVLCKLKSTNVNYKTSINTQIQHKTSTNTQNNTKTIQIPQKTRNKQRN